jgi:hypothetical protein
MSELTGLNERTLRRWTQKLEDRGWVKDLDVGVQGRPHRIVTTNKVELVMELKAAEAEDRTESPNSKRSDRGSDQIGQRIRSHRTEDPIRSDTESDKETKGDNDKRRGKKQGGAAAPVSDVDVDEFFSKKQEHPEKTRRRVKRFKVGSDPGMDMVKASDLAKERKVPDWAVVGPEGVHPAFEVVESFCELTGQSVDTLGSKRGLALLRQYKSLGADYQLEMSYLAQAHGVLRGENWGAWYIENHKWSTGYEQKYVDQLVLAAGQIRDGQLQSAEDGQIVENVPDEILAQGTGLKAILAHERIKERRRHTGDRQ